MKRFLNWITIPCRLAVLCVRLAAFTLGLAWRRRRARALFRRRLQSLGIEPAVREVLAESFDRLPSFRDLIRGGTATSGRATARARRTIRD